MIVEYKYDIGDRVITPSRMADEKSVREGVIGSARIDSLRIITYEVLFPDRKGISAANSAECWREDKLSPWIPADSPEPQVTNQF
jgi:hypothetical protein